MKILIVATEIKLPDVHGGSTHVKEVETGLRQYGETLVLAREGSTGDGRLPLGIPMKKFPIFMRHLDAKRTYKRVLEAARAFEPDVIYERATSYGVGGMLSRALGVPLLVMLLDRRFSNISLTQASKIVGTRKELVPEYVLNKFEKTSWGANEAHFHPNFDKIDARKKLGIAEDAFVVGYAGSFKGFHGLEVMIEAAKLSPKAHFLMIGDGDRRNAIESAVERQGLSERFTFTGLVSYEELPALIIASDVGVAPYDPNKHGPSRKLGRGFLNDPLKVFEYLAQKIPTITIRSPNIEELFEEEVHLKMYRATDANELAQRIEEYQNNTDLAARHAEDGFAQVLSNNTWKAHCAHLHELFLGMTKKS